MEGWCERGANVLLDHIYLGVPYCSDGLWGNPTLLIELVFEAVDAADLQVLSWVAHASLYLLLLRIFLLKLGAREGFPCIICVIPTLHIVGLSRSPVPDYCLNEVAQGDEHNLDTVAPRGLT